MNASVALAELLLDGLRAQAPSTFVPRGIEVQVGALLDVDLPALHAALSAALPGAEVRFVVTPGLLRCLDCGAEYPADEFPCPVCGSAHHEVVSGNELQVLRAWG